MHATGNNAKTKNTKEKQRVYLAEETPIKLCAYYKDELAAIYNVYNKTFSSWMHNYLEELKQFGYKKSTKLLRPEIVRFLFERLGER